MTDLAGHQLTQHIRRKFTSYYKNACSLVLSEQPQDLSRVFFLRPSSFPYCGLRQLFQWPKVIDDEDKRYLGASALFYTSVGTAFHEVFQEILGKNKQIIGNWKCPKCGSLKLFTTYTRCSKCNVPRQYQELEVTYKNTLIGHLDGLFLDKKTNTYWVIDYKSTSAFSLMLHEKHKNVFPYPSNVDQISAYVPLLEKLHKIKVSGYILFYLSRDNPFKIGGKLLHVKRMGPKAKAAELGKLDRYVRLYRQTLTVKSLSDLEEVYANKLCRSKSEYQSLFKESYNECPHHKMCFSKKQTLAAGAVLLKTETTQPLYPIINWAPKDIRKQLDL